MFDASNRLVIPIRVIGGGGYGTVYQAKRYNAAISQRVWDDISRGVASVTSVDQQASQQDDTNASPTQYQNTLSPTQKGGLRGGGASTGSPSSSAAAVPQQQQTNDDTPYDIVAVKEVSFELLDDAIEDILKEVTFMAGMRHRNVVRYMGSFLHDGTYGGGFVVGGGASGGGARSSTSGASKGQQQQGAAYFTSAELEVFAQRAMNALYSSDCNGNVVSPTPQHALGTSNQCHSACLPAVGIEAFSPMPSMCVVEEYIHGMSLSELIRIRTAGGMSGAARGHHQHPQQQSFEVIPLTPTELAVVLGDVLCAIDYLHTDARIVHRDIKCANIVVDEREGVAKLLDFGTCGAIDNPRVTRHTVLGTPGWIAPEVLEGGIVTTAGGAGARLGYGFRSDMWSFGVTVLELVFLRPSTSSEADQFFAKAIKYFSQVLCSASDEMRAAQTAAGSTRPIIPPRSGATPFNLPEAAREVFTDALQDLVACCLRRNPSQRPTAAELLKHPYFDEGSTTQVNSTAAATSALKKLVASTRALSATLPEKVTVSSSPRHRPMLAHPAGGSSSAHTGRQEAANTGNSAVIRAPYQMQFVDAFMTTYSESACLAKLNEQSAAASMDVLKNVLAPAARSAPALAMEIHKKFKTVVALQSGVPVATAPDLKGTASAAAASAASADAAKGPAKTPASAPTPQPPASGPILPPESQRQLQELALGYHAEDPERQRRAMALMERHVELLYALEAKLPGFAEKFTAKFLESLIHEHPDGGDVVANAVQMMTRLRADVLKPDILLGDPSANTIEATADKWKEQKPPVLAKMIPSGAAAGLISTSGGAGKSVGPAEGGANGAKPPTPAPAQQYIDPTAYLFNQMIDNYTTSGAAGGVAGANQQQPSRWAGV